MTQPREGRASPCVPTTTLPPNSGEPASCRAVSLSLAVATCVVLPFFGLFPLFLVGHAAGARRSSSRSPLRFDSEVGVGESMQRETWRSEAHCRHRPTRKARTTSREPQGLTEQENTRSKSFRPTKRNKPTMKFKLDHTQRLIPINDRVQRVRRASQSLPS